MKTQIIPNYNPVFNVNYQITQENNKFELVDTGNGEQMMCVLCVYAAKNKMHSKNPFCMSKIQENIFAVFSFSCQKSQKSINSLDNHLLSN